MATLCQVGRHSVLKMCVLVSCSTSLIIDFKVRIRDKVRGNGLINARERKRFKVSDHPSDIRSEDFDS